MTTEMIEKRNLLRTISNAAIEAAKDMDINPDEYKVNDLIMSFAYNPNKSYTFNTFMGWKFEGFTVKKGAKAYLLWGQPINKTRIDKLTGQTTQGSDDDQEAPFFPLAYLFRNDQVSKPEPKARIKHTKQETPVHDSIDIDI